MGFSRTMRCHLVCGGPTRQRPIRLHGGMKCIRFTGGLVTSELSVDHRQRGWPVRGVTVQACMWLRLN